MLLALNNPTGTLSLLSPSAKWIIQLLRAYFAHKADYSLNFALETFGHDIFGIIEVF